MAARPWGEVKFIGFSGAECTGEGIYIKADQAKAGIEAEACRFPSRFEVGKSLMEKNFLTCKN